MTEGNRTQTHYCIYVPAIRQYVYTPAFVQRIVDLLSTEEGYKQTVGLAPRRKVTNLPDGKKVAQRAGAASSA